MDALEAFELLNGASHTGVKVAYIELHHLVGGVAAGIGDSDGSLNIDIHAGYRLAENQVGIAERGITESVAEGIERVVAHIEIVACVLVVLRGSLLNGAACLQIVIIEGHLTESLRHRHGELATGHLVAEEHIADGIGCLGTSKPHVHYGINVLLLPREHRGTAREVEQHHGLAQLHQLFKQLMLHVGHIKIGTARAFAREVGTLAHGAHNDIGLPSHLQSLGLGLLVVDTRNGLAKLSGTLQRLVSRNVGTLGIEHFGLVAHRTLHSLLDGGVALGGISHTPRACYVLAVVSHRTYQSYLALLLERKHRRSSALLHAILQQHESLGSQLARSSTVGIGVDVLGTTLRVQILIRVGKETELVLGLEYAAARLVDVFHRHHSVFERLLERTDIPQSTHIHIGASLQCGSRVFLHVAQSVSLHTPDGGIVGNDETVEFPLFTKNVVKEPTVGSGVLAIYQVERCHERACASLGSSLVGREILVIHTQVAHVYGVVVASGLNSSIECKVLHAGHNLVFSFHSIALIATHVSLAHLGTKERVFAVALGIAAPTGIKGNVDHRTVDPVYSVGRCFLGSNASCLLNSFEVP